MTFQQRLVNTILKGIIHIICKVDVKQFTRIPRQGPLILVGNHINFIDAPVLVIFSQPRPITGYAKIETWNNPILGKLFTMWDMIPIRRGEADTSALRSGIEALKAGKILGIAPEGTRSGDGKLQAARPGMITLAQHSGAPILPVAIYGNEHLWENLKRLRRTNFHVVVGRQFRLKTDTSPVNRETRQTMTNEIMYQLAALLPAEYRGVYAELSQATTDYLEFLE